MARKTSHKRNGRAKRFAFRFPVHFQEVDSRVWFEGTTENISRTGVLFTSASPLSLTGMHQLRLRISVAAVPNLAEIHCTGEVVRSEPREVPEASVALAVAIRDFKLVRQSPPTALRAGMA